MSWSNLSKNSASGSNVSKSNILTVTISAASPSVITSTTHGMVTGDIFSLISTGKLPTGISANKRYYVIATGLTADAFQYSATSGGSAVNTSGSQSGTHKLIKLTFSNTQKS